SSRAETRWPGPWTARPSRPMRWRRSRVPTCRLAFHGRAVRGRAASAPRFLRQQMPVERGAPDILVDAELPVNGRERALVAVRSLAETAGDSDRNGRARIVDVEAV